VSWKVDGKKVMGVEPFYIGVNVEKDNENKGIRWYDIYVVEP
jgi:hypothetical protein